MIEQEGPIHRNEIVRRIVFLFGKQRIGPRIAEGIFASLQSNAPDLRHEEDFWITPEQKNTPIVRDRSAAPSSLRKLDMIARSEIRSAIEIARQQSLGADESYLADKVAKLLGLRKSPPMLRNLVHS